VSSQSLDIAGELTLFRPRCATKEDVIFQLAELLERRGHVRSTFREAVLDRELAMPTGLQTLAGGVAIPHTDNEHVIRSAIAVALLESPVLFRAMAAPEQEVPVTVVFMLAIAEAASQPRVLSRLATLFKSSEMMAGLVAAQSPGDLAAYLAKTLGIVQISGPGRGPASD
jgi:PTS system galactitol-specific IIA component